MTTRTQGSKSDEDLLARIMVEILGAPRDARRAAIEKHILCHPQLQSQIEQQMEVVEALEDAAPRATVAASARSVGAHLDGLPELLQKVIVLRNFKKLGWNEISAQLGLPETDLQRIHAKAMRELVERFGREAREGHDE